MSRSRRLAGVVVAVCAALALAIPNADAAAFTMATDTSTVILNAGGSVSVTFRFLPKRPKPFTLKLIGLPAGVRARTACGVTTCTSTLSALAATPTRSATVIVQAASGTTTRKVPITLLVRGRAAPAPPATVAATTAVPTSAVPTSAVPTTTAPKAQPFQFRAPVLIQTTDQTSGNLVFPISVTRAGWSGAIALTTTALPPNWRAAFLPANPVLTESTTLALTMPTGTVEGDYRITVTARSATDTTNETFVVRVRPVKLSVSVVSPPSGTAGASTTFTVDARSLDNPSLAVNLTMTGLPTTVTAQFATNPVVGQTTVTLTLPSTLAPGSYPFTVTASRDGFAATTASTLTVAQGAATFFTPTPVTATAGDVHGYQLASTPGSLSVVKGTSAFFDVTVAPKGGFKDPIGIALDLPAGWTSTLSTGTANVFRMTVSVPAAAVPGAYTATLRTFSGSLTANLSIPISVS